MSEQTVRNLNSDLDRAVVVIGAGGHAKVAIEALRYSGFTVIGCTDSDVTPRTIVGVSVIGDDGQLPEVLRTGVSQAFVAIGNNRMREQKAAELTALGFGLPTAIGLGAIVSPSARIGRGVAIFGGAIINADSRIDDLAIINTNASIDHDCQIGRAAHVAPGCAIAGCVSVGDRTFIGAGTSIIPQIAIGKDSIIGAGSAIIRDIPDEVTAVGVPARVIG